MNKVIYLHESSLSILKCAPTLAPPSVNSAKQPHCGELKLAAVREQRSHCTTAVPCLCCVFFFQFKNQASVACLLS